MAVYRLKDEKSNFGKLLLQYFLQVKVEEGEVAAVYCLLVICSQHLKQEQKSPTSMHGRF
jgi:hypothetical protein